MKQLQQKPFYLIFQSWTPKHFSYYFYIIMLGFIIHMKEPEHGSGEDWHKKKNTRSCGALYNPNDSSLLETTQSVDFIIS